MRSSALRSATATVSSRDRRSRPRRGSRRDGVRRSPRTCARTCSGSGAMSIASASSRERSRSCSTSARHALRLLEERVAHLLALLLVEPVGEVVQRRHEAVDRRHRRSQLVRGERDEVRLHLVRALEREPRLVLGLEEADAVEREADERAERAQQRELLVAEERCVRRRPDDEAAAGHLEVDDLGVVPERRRSAPTLEARPRVVGHVPGGDDLALGVADRDRARADDRRRRLEHARGDLLLRLREREQARDRLLDARAVSGARHQRRTMPRRREAEEEGEPR